MDVSSLQRVALDVSKQYKRSVVAPGDVLVSIVGTIGRVAVVPPECDGFNIARAVARLAPGPRITSEYLALLLTSEELQIRLVGESFETARKTLNLSALGALTIPVPALEQQRELTNRLMASKALVSGVESHMERVLDLRKRATQCLLTPGGIDVQ